jgi:hypothetical protein
MLVNQQDGTWRNKGKLAHLELSKVRIKAMVVVGQKIVKVELIIHSIVEHIPLVYV